MKILIDLSILKTPNCGLGQVALNYGRFFKDYYAAQPELDIYLLVPKQYIGAFGNNVKYIRARKIYRLMPWLTGIRFDVWHAIHQLSRFRPFCKHYILTIHDFNFVYEKSDSPRKVKSYLAKIQHKVDRADRIVAISQFAKSETERYVKLNGKSVEVVYNGIERIDLHKAGKPKSVREPFFFTIGEVKEKKNFHVLLDMMRLMPDYHLYIAGNDSTEYAKELYRRLAAERLNNVHLLGIVSPAERVWLYSRCAAFLFPSLFEGFGLPVVEAMLFRKAIVCSGATSLSEIGGNYVSYFPADFAPEASVAVIRKALKTSNSRLNEAFKYACSFSWEEHMHKYINLYLSVCK